MQGPTINMLNSVISGCSLHLSGGHDNEKFSPQNPRNNFNFKAKTFINLKRRVCNFYS